MTDATKIRRYQRACIARMQKRIKVSDLSLSIRSINLCKSLQIETISQLAMIDFDELERTKAVGKVTINELKTTLYEFGGA